MGDRGVDGLADLADAGWHNADLGATSQWSIRLATNRTPPAPQPQLQSLSAAT